MRASAEDAPAGNDPGAIARRIVAENIGVSTAAVRVVSITARAFPDGSLGCPRSGMAFAQVITPGHVVITEASGRRFDVRVAGSGGRICHGRGPVKAQDDQPATGPALSVEAARRDLAGHLQIAPESIALIGTRPARPDDRLPGCAPCGKAADDCGTVVTLELDGRRYQYLGTGKDVQSCPPLAVR